MVSVHTFDFITYKGSEEEIVWIDLQPQVSDFRENPWQVQRELH
jgi:hypothetical protein